jgi:hypothetical protein
MLASYLADFMGRQRYGKSLDCFPPLKGCLPIRLERKVPVFQRFNKSIAFVILTYFKTPIYKSEATIHMVKTTTYPTTHLHTFFNHIKSKSSISLWVYDIPNCSFWANKKPPLPTL